MPADLKIKAETAIPIRHPQLTFDIIIEGNTGVEKNAQSRGEGHCQCLLHTGVPRLGGVAELTGPIETTVTLD